MKNLIFIIIGIVIFSWSCQKTDDDNFDTSDEISIDSLTATYYSLKAWDTTGINCYATGDSLVYSWECDHGSFNGSGNKIKYAAGECCIGINTIICTVTNSTGKVSKDIKIEVTSYYEN